MLFALLKLEVLALRSLLGDRHGFVVVDESEGHFAPLFLATVDLGELVQILVLVEALLDADAFSAANFRVLLKVVLVVRISLFRLQDDAFEGTRCTLRFKRQ